MIDPKEKQKIYVLIAIFGLAGLLLYYNLLLKPMYSGFAVKNKEFRTVRDRVKSGEALIKNEEGIKRQYDNFQKQAVFLEKRLPSQNQISGLLEDLSKVADSSGVSILRIKPLEEPVLSSKQKSSGNSYIEFPILIEARAGYHQLGLFVNKLETMDRFIKIADIDIAGTDKNLRNHDIKIRIITYVLQ